MKKMSFVVNFISCRIVNFYFVVGEIGFLVGYVVLLMCVSDILNVFIGVLLVGVYFLI